MNTKNFSSDSFGCIKDGSAAHLYHLGSSGKLEALVSDYGATLVSLTYPDKNGNILDVVLGYDTAAEYEAASSFFGATVGRNANRIDQGRFEIEGKTYQMAANENENNLHSGPDFTNQRMWQTEAVSDSSVTFSLFSPDGDQGFPGNLKFTLTYTITEDDTLQIRYHGECDQTTVFNPTNHSFFNLNGHASGSTIEHVMQINADKYTPVIDSKSIPTGALADVAGTPLDLREPTPISKGIDAEFDQLQFTGGYDHNYEIRNRSIECDAARVYSPESGICMTVRTDLPGLQFYAGNFITTCSGKDGATYNKRGGFCLETQYYPNSINDPAFESPLLKGEAETVTEYGFSLI